ncbi:hypothetical protein RSOLAG1IB_05007 [Rhizoctonia solani AG-1 IB]|uniref:Zn(2)-C6 fungal-type domain-containing protein n=1 Tax=Thanatephorus cucumeris (strain AG1-IB / isolate 7/3/14) TaxID=1108050 RepID=A0A0B7FXJ2_THACB|nr:hypothetical protein RSOLAG1IB_05007 [Rhizoctonia solani AG-1 IB]
MQQSSNNSTTSSSSGPLRRNQACHQCRARKLKCDAGRPCSTCRRSHAKAIASLTSSGQAVLADPCCTYDYAPGEDPWTATVRNGLGLSPSITRSKSGSTSPAGPSTDPPVLRAKISTSSSPPTSVPQIGPLRARHSSASRKRSPPYPSPGETPPLGYDSAYVGSPASLGHLSSTGAQGVFLSSLPSHADARGLPGVSETSNLHTTPPYVPSHSFNTVHQDFEYEEMAQMLYSPMGPFYDPPILFSPLPCYASSLPVGEYSANEMPIYAHNGDDLGNGIHKSQLYYY